MALKYMGVDIYALGTMVNDSFCKTLSLYLYICVPFLDLHKFTLLTYKTKIIKSTHARVQPG